MKNFIYLFLGTIIILISCWKINRNSNSAVFESGNNYLDPTVGRLIDDLVNINSEGPMFHTLGYNHPFLPLGDSLPYKRSVWKYNKNAEKPNIPIALQEIIRFGPKALPDLSRHVTDSRNTGVFLGKNELVMKMWKADFHNYSKEKNETLIYIMNYSDLLYYGRGQSYQRGQEIKGSYNVKVGDLCYIAIGQIVNRRYSICRYVPSLCCEINSPLNDKKLALHLQKSYRSSIFFKENLVNDLEFYEKSIGALVRLYFYYPEEDENGLYMKKILDNRISFGEKALIINTLSLVKDKRYDNGIKASLLDIMAKGKLLSEPSNELDEFIIACMDRFPGWDQGNQLRNYFAFRLNKNLPRKIPTYR